MFVATKKYLHKNIDLNQFDTTPGKCSQENVHLHNNVLIAVVTLFYMLRIW